MKGFWVVLAVVLVAGSAWCDDVGTVFSDAERKGMPEAGAFEYKLVEKDGVMVPRVNGRGLMGVSAGFANEDVRQLEYEAPILAQQGINHLKMGMRPLGYGYGDWVKDQEVLQRLGISAIWSYYAMCAEDGFYDCFLEQPVGTLGGVDRIIGEDGKPGYFRGAGTLGNYFSRAFLEATDKVVGKAVGYLSPFPTVVGYQYSNEVNAGTGSFDPEARAKWQEFVKSLFGDESPDRDSNGDGVWFNKTFGKDYKSWGDVEQFRGEDWQDPRKALLRDACMGLNYARFVDRACAVARKDRPEMLAGGIVCVPLSPTVDLSLLLTMPHVSAAYINTYFGWLGGGQLMEAIADTYRKPAITSEMNMPYGSYEDVKWGGLTNLPYLEGYEWFYYSWAPKEAGGEHGGKFGFVDRWNVDLTKEHGEGFVGPYKAVEYNPRFAIIPQLAPFVGRLHAGYNREILWISASGYPRDWLEDHEETGITRAEVTSDVALALAPKALDLNRYKVIIYRNLQSPCISRDIYLRLREFVRGGGTVVTGGYYIAADGTWIGQDNKRDWWQGMRLGGEARTEDGVSRISYGGLSCEVKGTFPYLVADGDSVSGAGSISTSAGGSYPFVLSRSEGRGKWVFVNMPYFLQITEPYEGFDRAKYAQRFAMLRKVIADYSGVVPADRYATQWYTGEDCVLAMREPHPDGKAQPAAAVEGAPWRNGKYVMFETFDLTTEGGKPYTEVKDGRIRCERDLGPKEARLWVVKPYGRPVVLYADGTIKNGARLESGTYKDGRLTFKFAERAFVSSPVRPESLEVDGKPWAFSYDEKSEIVRIEREGQIAEAVLRWERN